MNGLRAGDVIDIDLSEWMGWPKQFELNRFVVVENGEKQVKLTPLNDPARYMRLSEVGTVFKQIAKGRK